MDQSGGGMASWNTWKLSLGAMGESLQEKDMYHMYQAGSWEQKQGKKYKYFAIFKTKIMEMMFQLK